MTVHTHLQLHAAHLGRALHHVLAARLELEVPQGPAATRQSNQNQTVPQLAQCIMLGHPRSSEGWRHRMRRLLPRLLAGAGISTEKGAAPTAGRPSSHTAEALHSAVASAANERSRPSAVNGVGATGSHAEGFPAPGHGQEGDAAVVHLGLADHSVVPLVDGAPRIPAERASTGQACARTLLMAVAPLPLLTSKRSHPDMNTGVALGAASQPGEDVSFLQLSGAGNISVKHCRGAGAARVQAPCGVAARFHHAGRTCAHVGRMRRTGCGRAHRGGWACGRW